MFTKPMFVKRKKFTEKPTSKSRLHDRWDQEVFFMTQKHPTLTDAITAIQENHAAKMGGSFVPTEESLAELANLRHTLA